MSDKDLPPGWAWAELRDLGTWYGGGTPSKANIAFWTDGDVPWLSPKDMGCEVLAGTQDHVTAAAVSGSAAKLVPSGSVAVVVRSGILERTFPVALVPFATTLNQDMKAVVPHGGIEARWLAHTLRGREREILGSCRRAGTTVASIESVAFQRLRIAVPPHPEQQRIVSELERRLSHIEATERSLRSAVVKLDAAEGTLVEGAIMGRLLASTGSAEDAGSEVKRLVEAVAERSPRAKWRNVSPAPLGDDEGMWPTVALGRIAADAGYGTSEKTSATGEGVTVLRIPNIRRRAIDLTELKFLGADHVTTDQQLSEGDILFIRSNGSPSLIGVAAAVTAAAVGHTFASYLIRFRLEDPVLARWVELVASAPSRRRWLIQQSSSSAGQHNLGQPDIAALPIPVPAREDMERVLREFDRRRSLLAAARRTCEQQLARCEQARRTVLTYAFTGRLVEQHPEEELATKLLERIAADRAATPTPKRRRTAGTSKEKSA